MRILNVIQCSNLGGMEQSNLLKIRALRSRGHSVRLVSLNPIGALGPRLKDAGIPHEGLEYRGWFGWRSVLAMRRCFLAYPTDAVLMTGHNLPAMLALAGVRVPRKVLAIHYHHFEDNKRFMRWRVFYALAVYFFDHVIFVSEMIRQEALEVCPRLNAVSSVVANPFEMPRLPTGYERSAARECLGIPKETKVIVNAGWLISRKRWDVFLAVAAKICAVYPDSLFLIAGDGPERQTLEQTANTLGVASRVRFLGWQPNLEVFYRTLDVLLFNSDFDALGRTPGEAAAHGVAVVASVVSGGLTELFRSEEEAVVLRSHDIEALSGAVLGLLDDPVRREVLARAGRARVAEYGDLDHHASEVERLLSANDCRTATSIYPRDGRPRSPTS